MSFRIFKLLTAAQVAELNASLSNAEFTDGRTTAGSFAAQVKNNEQFGRSQGNEPSTQEAQLIEQSLASHQELLAYVKPAAYFPPSFNRYSVGMFYGNHCDSPVMQTRGRLIRTDLSMTLFLSEPDSYDGGELVLESEFGEEAIKLEGGSAVVYNANMIHRVEPVTRGTRVACITWFQSQIADTAMRELIFDLTLVQNAMLNSTVGPTMVNLLSKSVNTLVRKHYQG